MWSLRSFQQRGKKGLGWGLGAKSTQVFLPFVLQPSSPTAAADATQSTQIICQLLRLVQALRIHCKTFLWIFNRKHGSMPWLSRGSCCFRRFQKPEPGTFLLTTKGKQILLYLHPWHFRSWVPGPQQKHLKSALGWGLSAGTPGGRDARGGSGGARGSVLLRIRNLPLWGFP